MTLTQTLSTYVTQAAPAVGTLFLAAVTWLCYHGAAWMKAHTKNALVLGMTDRLSTEVQTGVAAAEQTAVADARAAGANLSRGTAAEIKAAVLAQVTANLGGDKWIAQAQKVLGVADVQAYLSQKIEAAVLALNTPPAMATPVVVVPAKP
jgi:hypothetical protein